MWDQSQSSHMTNYISAFYWNDFVTVSDICLGAFYLEKLGFESLQRLSWEQKINTVVNTELELFAAIACVNAIGNVSSINFAANHSNNMAIEYVISTKVPVYQTGGTFKAF